ncbi:MAG: hypothetical protein HZY76_06125 [Anaerolineae bacterium]|nr:MAG: hypothetical protein HZY76_06125 [Anaerolineae bacterium]
MVAGGGWGARRAVASTLTGATRPEEIVAATPLDPALATAVQRRILACIINEAYYALGEGVATADDIDTAMRLGTNYPRGPLAWGEALGLEVVRDTLRGCSASTLCVTRRRAWLATRRPDPRRMRHDRRVIARDLRVKRNPVFVSQARVMAR